MVTLTAAIACAALAQPLAEPGKGVRYDGDKVVSVIVDDEKIRRAVIGLSKGLWGCGEPGPGVPLQLHIAPHAMAALDDLGVAYVVEIENIQALIDVENTRLADAAREPGAPRGELPGTFFNDFRTNDQISEYMDALVAAYPERVSRSTIGHSVEGREIYAMRLNASKGLKPVIVINALQHGDEWITGTSGNYVFDRLVRNPDADPRVAALLADFEILYVPVLNPDGYAYAWSTQRFWRKNRRPPEEGSTCYGVDNNRNWGAFWAPISRCIETASGPEPFSELENQAMRDLAIATPGMVAYVDLHSGAQKLLSPYSHRIAPPEREAELFDEVNNRLMAAFSGVYGDQWPAGPAYAILGYSATGTSKDWYFEERGALAWTWELLISWETPSLIEPTARATMAGLLALGDGAREVLLRVRFAGPGRPVRVSSVAATSLVILVERGAAHPDPSGTRLWWRLGRVGPFTEAELTAQEDGSTLGVLPTTPCGAVLQYYVEARTAEGAMFASPLAGAAAPYEATASDPMIYAAFDMESSTGWIAAPSQWVNVDPNGTAAQPEYAAEGTRCWVTRDASPGLGLSRDVNGLMQLVSEPINLEGRSELTVSYRRWFCTNTGPGGDADTFLVEASPDEVAWYTVDSIGPGPQRGRGWFESSFCLDDAFVPTGQTRLRFSATDAAPQSIVEAGVDDMVIFHERCPAPCTGDWTRDGTVNSTDVSEFINTWFEDQVSGTLNADFDGNGISNSTDVSEFINAWFEPC